MSASIRIAGIELSGVEKVASSYKIDKDVLDALAQTEKRLAKAVELKKIKPYKINRSVIVEEALRAFIRETNAQLEKLGVEEVPEDATTAA